jgi:pyridoxamine 5'-phosphate oxidase
VEHDPIKQFKTWWQLASNDSPLKQKSAACVSTINEDGYPDGRFVDLKEVDNKGFVFCTYLDSQKGKHLANNPKVSLTLWWDHLGYQVRVIGNAEQIDDEKAKRFWTTRTRDAQLTTSSFQQSAAMPSMAFLHDQFAKVSQTMADKNIPKPTNWGGYCIQPLTIEFLTFQDNRLHVRELYSREDNLWRKTLLQP